jgi:eukaryotic-like serine/threonine-protein kinase
VTTNRFARLKAIVLRAEALSPAARNEYLDRACADDHELRREVDSILVCDSDGPSIVGTHGIADKLAAAGGEALFGDLDPLDPTSIGPYRITGVLGEGGMGVVYRANQTEPIQREVAIKLVRWGLGSREATIRFEAERQALARMDHPHIAKVLDAGADDQGRPYFVMDLVPGVPVTRFCRDNETDLDARLHLLLAICRAMQHAHQKGLIHRDLKPSNILVSLRDGIAEPKIIDFGIAQAVEESVTDQTRLTREGQPIGTLGYMSPEQARGAMAEIDTRSDVYALGAVMYELLTGEPPHGDHEASLLSQIRAVCEESPRPFREVLPASQKLDGDLEVITRKALAIDPGERYPSAAALADDIERYCESQPIAARPPSAAYQLKKLVTRNKVPSLLVAGIVLLVVGFGVWMSFLFARSEANLRRALQAESEAENVSDYMTGLFEVSHPATARGGAITAREILDIGAERIDAELSTEPAVQARLRYTLGQVYGGLGIHDRAESMLRNALRQEQQIAPDNGLDHARVLNELGTLYLKMGRYAEADSAFERCLHLREGILTDADPQVAVARANFGWTRAIQGQMEEGEQLLNRAIETFEQQADSTSMDHPAALNNLARIAQEQGQYDRAEELQMQALAMNESRLPPDHPEIANCLNNLANLYWVLGRLNEAVPLAQRSLEIYERILGDDHPDLATPLLNMAKLNEDRGDLVQAERELRRALAIREAALAPDHPSLAVTWNNLGMLYRKLEDPIGAEQALRRALDIKIRNNGPEHASVATTLNNLGEVKVDQQRFTEAADFFRRSLAIRVTAYGADDPRTSLPEHNLGMLFLSQSRLDEAEPLLVHALQVRKETLGPVHYRIVDSLRGCADLYRATGRRAEAESMEAQAIAMAQQ